MKKTFLLFLLFTMTTNIIYAQKDVTKFLGIPVDGSKSEMKTKLQGKGFTYNAQYDAFDGEFNGRNVHVFIATNNNKVWRIMVADAQSCSETDIKIRFNKLCGQFYKNSRYIPVNGGEKDYTIDAKEDISYEQLVHNKRYEAIFYQKPDNDLYNEEQLGPEKYYDLLEKKIVWFTISSQYGQYWITMFYDNEYNHSDGEDL